jgi:hypothetical protein
MHIRITCTLDHHDRCAMAQSRGEQRPASSAMCRNALYAWALSALETVVDDDEQSLHADGRIHDQERPARPC